MIFTMHKPDTTERISYLRQFITDKRYDVLNNILNKRTRHITVALEDINRPHNASAVLRSCDCFGIQDVHIIENRNKLDISGRVTRGAESWLTIQKYKGQGRRNTEKCIKTLKSKGYKIIAMTPHDPVCELGDLEADDKLALLFGTEKVGLSDTVLKQADKRVVIPMRGFTESFNISVSVALVLFALRAKLEASSIRWELDDREKQELMLEWLRHSIREFEMIEDGYFGKEQKLSDQ